MLHHSGNVFSRLHALRWVEVGCQAVMLIAVQHWLAISPGQTASMAAAVLGLALFNLLVAWRLRKPWPGTDPELFAHLCVDVLALDALLYFSGGSTNPFISLLLMPLTIAGAVLPSAYCWVMGLFTLASYTALMFFHTPLPLPRVELPALNELAQTLSGAHAGHMHSKDSVFGLHILGMWFNFFASALIIVVFLTRLALMLRARERELVAAREAGLRSEQVLALGTLAAGAAHQLGTPLSTMAVVLRELEIEHAGEGSLPESLALLRHQVDRCKGLLSELLSQAGQPRSEASGERGLNDLLEDLADQWRLLRPQTVLRSTLLTEGPAPRIPADPSLQRAILNLLDNAADASPDEILMTARWDKRGEALRCTIEILDRGPGLNAAGAQRIGQPFVTTKSEQGGLGIGLFLSHATLERFGGSLELLERPGGGTCSRITLPGRWNPK